MNNNFFLWKNEHLWQQISLLYYSIDWYWMILFSSLVGMDYKPIELDKFEPYGELLTQLTVNLQQNDQFTKTLPSKIPEVFPGLLELEFVGADLLEELPESLSQITELENLSIRWETSFCFRGATLCQYFGINAFILITGIVTEEGVIFNRSFVCLIGMEYQNSRSYLCAWENLPPWKNCSVIVVTSRNFLQKLQSELIVKVYYTHRNYCNNKAIR